MSKKNRVTKKVVLLILVLIILMAILVYYFGNMALKSGIETAASKTLNVAVTVDGVDLSVLSGRVGLRNLMVDNPPDYEHDKMLKVSTARISVSIGSLLSDTVNVKEIVFDGIDVVVEQKGLSNNLQEVINSIPKSEKKPEAETKKPGKKLHIDSLEITNVTVRVKLLPIAGKADVIPLKLAPIRMTDLGGDNGLDTAKLTGKILLAITKGIAEQGAGLLPDAMTDGMKDSLDKAAELVAEGEKILEEGKDIVEGFKGLFKKK